uniref:Tc1-like transposase DDE domain-containing protein n=1 Tax=Panagrolaimus sp. JU765 TaxID=591449 RepID=A0AC34RR90_9BILA
MGLNHWSGRKIAKKIKRLPDVACKFFKNPRSVGTRKASGRPPKQAERDKRHIHNAASNSTRSANKTHHELNLNVHDETVRLVLQNDQDIELSEMVRAPTLEDFHKLKRLEFARNNMATNWKHQDNTTIHASSNTMNWFQRNQINVIKWPTRSPDLNPMENLWGILVRRVYANNRHYNEVNELKTAILRAWLSVDGSILDNHVLSMPKRIADVLEAGGKPIKY